ncbi:MAG: NAD(P)-dependent oxidoreductase, partial [Acidimicrobiia bacterium]
LHVPLSKSTQGMIGRHELSAMRAGSMLVNTSRGEVIDEHATATSVVHGHLAGVGVDVLAGESEAGFDPRQSPLVRAQRDGFNVIVTPHIGGWTDSATAHTRAALVTRVLEAL